MPDSIWSAIGQEDQLRHQLHGVARRPVLARLLVVLLVEAADQLLEDRAHRVVVEAGVLDRAVAVQHRLRAQVDVRREELLDQRAERVGLREARDLVAELEVLEDVLDVRREAVEVGLEVGLELLLAGAGPEVAQRELRGVVEGLAGRLPQGLVLVDDARLVERGLHVEHGLLGRLEHRVEAAQDGHRQDDVAVLAADVEVAQDVVGDAPDEVGDPVELNRFHLPVSFGTQSGRHQPRLARPLARSRKTSYHPARSFSGTAPSNAAVNSSSRVDSQEMSLKTSLTRGGVSRSFLMPALNCARTSSSDGTRVAGKRAARPLTILKRFSTRTRLFRVDLAAEAVDPDRQYRLAAAHLDFEGFLVRTSEKAHPKPGKWRR